MVYAIDTDEPAWRIWPTRLTRRRRFMAVPDPSRAAFDRTFPASRRQTLKLLPHPQVVLAFGLRITNCAPVRLSV